MKKIPLFILGLAIASPVFAAEPAQVELAQKVVKASQIDRMFDQMGPQMQQMALQSLTMTTPNLTPEQRDAATKILGEVTKVSIDAAKEMLQKVDGIYADVYTEAELKAMLAFFESPEGKSMVQKQPVIMQRMGPLVQAMQRELMPKIQQIVEKAKAQVGAGTANIPGVSPLPSPAAGAPVSSPSTSTGPVPIPSPKNSSGPTPASTAKVPSH